MIIKPRVRGFMCITTHPVGCDTNVKNQIDFIKSQPPVVAPKRVLVIGSSTGYGLAARITAAFGSGASTLGIFFEKVLAMMPRTPQSSSIYLHIFSLGANGAVRD